MGRVAVIVILAGSLIGSACGGSGGSDNPAAAAEAGVKRLDADSAQDSSPEAQAEEDAEASAIAPAATAESDAPRRPAVVDLASVPTGEPRDFGPAPQVPTGALSPEVAEAIDTLMGDRLLSRIFDNDSLAAIRTLGESNDPRVAWWLSDLLRVARDPDLVGALVASEEQLLGIEVDAFGPWGAVTDHLIGWDIPAPPDYLEYKRNAYVVVEPRWEPLFADDTNIDWRMVSWGGVLIDDRPFDQTDTPCNCIPAADNPALTDAAGGDAWLADDTIVFGVVINDDARAYPRSIMEVREMVNDTLGGRDIAMPYCTLCGSAQVYFTDEVPDGIERPVLRTSGLLTRSNKVMYDVNTFSIFDTFLGQAVSGPLAEAGVELSQHSVITTTWSQWKAAHPDTSVLAEELALGRPNSDLRNTRDANGPIFPIGQVDSRLPVQEDVLGLMTAEGQPIAFHVASALAALERGEFIEVEGIEVILDGGGVRAVNAAGEDLGGHQAFWFAWSQFHPDTVLWPS